MQAKSRISLFRSVRFKLMVVYLLLILFAMQLIGAYFIQAVNQYFISNYSRTISREALSLATIASHPLAKVAVPGRDVQQMIRPFAELANSSIYILDKDGNVVGTSANPFLIGQKRVDPEVNGALVGLQTDEIARDPLSGARFLYLAVPIRDRGQVVGAVEFVSPMSGIYQSIARIIIIFATGSLFALGLTAVLAAIIARTITGPISAVTQTAQALAGGDFNQTVPIHSRDEIGELASTFNMLSSRLRLAIANTEREKDRLQAIMSTMRDGVIATNSADEIVLMNPAAVQILNAKRPLLGARLRDVLPGAKQRSDVQLVELGERMIVVSATALSSERSRSVGVQPGDHRLLKHGGHVYVMRDVTEETRLEAARKRFVADVSHELRTPVTIIKGYIEALMEGANEDPKIADHFLRVMDKETDRMTRLISNLLELTRFDEHHEFLYKESVSVRALVNHLANRFALVAFRAGVQFIVEIIDDAWVLVDRDRIDQVLDNVISNSLKYTGKHGMIRVRVEVDSQGDRVLLTLKDTGAGIPAADLPHIFDRFYRVDKARSRQLGGTGLGLAIAREIVRAHGGDITANSQVGQGTTIRIDLPVETDGEIT